MIITQAALAEHWPHALPAMVAGFLATQADVFAKYEIVTPQRVAHFMGQISVECADGSRFEENLHYSHAWRLMKVWPSRFPTLASARPYIGNPKALAVFVYAGRNGNRLLTDDGWTYRGRGYIQLTGRDNYMNIGLVAGVDLVANPDLASEPNHALAVAAAYWKRAHCNEAADSGSVVDVTKRVKGSLQELSDRQAATSVWSEELHA